MKNASFTFTHALCRRPAVSITNGLRADDQGDPDHATFLTHHEQYVEALRTSGCQVTVLDPLEAYPDSVFIEDAALCLAGTAIVLRPGAESRFGESAALMPSLTDHFQRVVSLSGEGYVDGGDILVTDTEVLVGLSSRTNQLGFEHLSVIVEKLGYKIRKINTPAEILHFKTDCGLLDSQTIFASQALAATGCFENYTVIVAPQGESAAANLIRVNDTTFICEGFPNTKATLQEAGYKVVCLPNTEAAKVDGGLSCMSLRFTP